MKEKKTPPAPLKKNKIVRFVLLGMMPIKVRFGNRPKWMPIM